MGYLTLASALGGGSGGFGYDTPWLGCLMLALGVIMVAYAGFMAWKERRPGQSTTERL